MEDASKYALDMDNTLIKLEKYQGIVSSSKLFQETVQILEKYLIKSVPVIRCLALGSPSESNAALYQLAYLNELVQYFKTAQVTLFDPVFNDKDENIFKRYNYNVETSFEPPSNHQVLYFLPHADLRMTEDLFKTDKPKWLLSNDIIAHTDRYTKRKLFDEYRMISLVKNLLENGDLQSLTAQSGEFQVVASKKSRRNKKSVFVEPEIEYDYSEVYFREVKARKLLEVEGSWGNAFSDLAFHLVVPKDSESGDDTETKAIGT